MKNIGLKKTVYRKKIFRALKSCPDIFSMIFFASFAIGFYTSALT